MKTMKTITAVILSLSFMFLMTNPVSAQENADHHCKHHPKEGITMGGVKVETIGEDTMVIYIHKHHHERGTNWSTIPWGCKKQRFNGHWAGVDFGWNGYVNSDFTMDLPAGYEFLGLNDARSLMVNLNPFELNVNIARNKFGFTTGLGFQLNNYFFTDDYALYEGFDSLTAFRIYDEQGTHVTMKRNKLYVSYLTLPLLFEVQTNPKCRVNSFHFTFGVIGGLRLQSYQKEILTSYDRTLYLQNENGQRVASFEADKPVNRFHGPFYLNPFKADATVRIGWSYLNLFATYSLTPMYKKDKGPELYPWTVGITLVGW